MKVSLKWLQRFVDLRESPEEIAEVLAKIGLEVESIERKGCAPSNFVVVGQILDFEPHPNADRLNVCRLDVGDGNIRQIVCGAKNFKKEDYVFVALPGAVLPENVKIKQSKLRGVTSEGMMCSRRELGLGNDHEGLMILDKTCVLGRKIHEVLNDNDVVFTVELTANRGDVLCHYGIARELAAWYDRQLQPIPVPELSQSATPEVSSLEVDIQSPHCTCYNARSLKNITITESAGWVRRDLEAVGCATINNVVDITNWVLYAYGQPLHAFDREKFLGKITVRQARESETIDALDQKRYTLNSEVLVISDEHEAQAIAGIIGGEKSKIGPQTKEIVLESACFSADNIRKTSRQLGIMTDSAYRAIRHVDGAMSEDCLKIAAGMLCELYGARVVLPTLHRETVSLPRSWKIALRPDFVRFSLGLALSDDEIVSLLERLQYRVDRKNDEWIITVPSYRWDVTRPIDLVEECLRVYSVDKLPVTHVSAHSVSQSSVESTAKRRHIVHFLADNGFSECYNYSIVAPSVGALPLANPLLDEQTHFRTSLILGLVESLRYNVQNDNRDGKFFEIGHVVQTVNDTLEELLSVAFLIPVAGHEEHWDDWIKPSFFEAKNLLCHLWRMVTDATLAPVRGLKDDFYQEHFAAQIGEIRKGIEGHVGYLNADMMRDFQMPILGGELFITLDQFERSLKNHRYTPFSYFPSAKRDISIIVDRDHPAQAVIDDVQQIVTEAAKNIFSRIDVSVFDIYMGNNLSETQKSIGLNLVFGCDDRTPSEQEIDEVFEQLVRSIKQHPVLSLRGV
ncbi:MAG: phenylalanine--tRNA ligase subunit beta [Verrucomicrobiota bacterium]|nr:MAG: phenylalanine--tRNA ligase subunit beta [Verrucomicrobiota bacterium]